MIFRRDLSRTTVVATASLWLVLMMITHHGAKSPYAYGWAMFDGHSTRLFGTVVNPDLPAVYPVTRFFYDAAPLDYAEAHNLRLPYHSFAVSIVAAFTRSYLIANYVVNVLFGVLLAWAAVNLGDRFGIRRAPLLIALLTLFSLPMFPHYLGQPAQYIVGPAVNFLVVLALIGLEDRARNPLIAGLLTAVLTISYDYYVFAAAMVLFVLFFLRFRRWWQYPVYLVTAVAPLLAWTWWLSWISGGVASTHLQNTFISKVYWGWAVPLRDPSKHILLPFVTSHIGAHVGMHMIVAMIYWPLVAFLLIALYRYRPELRTSRGNWLIVLLVACFFVAQFGTAAWDWENNPRRALPIVLAFAWAYCWAAGRVFDSAPWRALLIALFVMSALLAHADTFLGSPVITFLNTGQAIRLEPKVAAGVERDRRLGDKQSMPTLMEDEKILWRDLERASVGGDRVIVFAVSQAFVGGMLSFLFWALGRAGLLPERATVAFAVVWVLSLGVRFL